MGCLPVYHCCSPVEDKKSHCKCTMTVLTVLCVRATHKASTARLCSFFWQFKTLHSPRKEPREERIDILDLRSINLEVNSNISRSDVAVVVVGIVFKRNEREEKETWLRSAPSQAKMTRATQMEAHSALSTQQDPTSHLCLLLHAIPRLQQLLLCYFP